MDETAAGSAARPSRLAGAWLPAVGWAALIFALSAQPGLRVVQDDALDLVVRKLGHMAVFGILALLLWRAIASTTSRRRPWAWALALAILYAVSDEVHQAFVATRGPSPVDVGIDAAGALVAIAAAAGALAVRRDPSRQRRVRRGQRPRPRRRDA